MKLSARVKPSTIKHTRQERLQRGRLASGKLCNVYPSVKQIRLALDFKDESPMPALASQLHQLNAPSRAFFWYPCPYGDCDGVFDLGSAIATLVSQATGELSSHVPCSGVRGAKRAPCGVQLDYVISADYC
jgi:hypothetical protein